MNYSPAARVTHYYRKIGADDVLEFLVERKELSGAFI